MGKSRFHAGIFYYAVSGLMEREPDIKVRMGGQGFLDMLYYPKNEGERALFAIRAGEIAKWLDDYDIIFSRSLSEFGVGEHIRNEKEALRVMVTYPIPEKDRW